MGRSWTAAMTLTLGVAVVCAALVAAVLDSADPSPEPLPEAPPTGPGAPARPATQGRVGKSPFEHSPFPELARGEAAPRTVVPVLSLSVMKPFAPSRPALAVEAILAADEDAAWKVREVCRVPAGERTLAIRALGDALGRDPSIAEILIDLLRTASGDELDTLIQLLRNGAAFQVREEIRPAALDVLRNGTDETRRIAAAWALRHVAPDPLPEDIQRGIIGAFREEQSALVLAALSESVTRGFTGPARERAIDEVLRRIGPGPERVRITDARFDDAAARVWLSARIQDYDVADSDDARNAIAADVVRRQSGGVSGWRGAMTESDADLHARQASHRAAFVRVYAGATSLRTRATLLAGVRESPWACFAATGREDEAMRAAHAEFLREVAAAEPRPEVAQRIRDVADRVAAGQAGTNGDDFLPREPVR